MDQTNETRRLQSLRELQLLDTPPEDDFDAIVRLAAEICLTSTAAVSLVDHDRQWFKARVGLAAESTPREWSFCVHAMEGNGTLIVPDARQDARFQANPLVTGDMGLRFYAGRVLKGPGGLPIGALCVIDCVPRSLTAAQVQALEALARQTEILIALRQSNARLQLELQERQCVQHSLEQTCQTLSTLEQIAKSISATATVAELAELVANSSVKASGAELGALVLTENEVGKIELYPCQRAKQGAAGWLKPVQEVYPQLLELVGGQMSGSWDDLPCVDGMLASQLVLCGGPARSLLFVPISSADGRYSGAIILAHSQPKRFTSFIHDLILGIGCQTSIALDNARLISRLQRVSQQMSFQSMHDALTGLPNRALFLDRVDQCLSRVNRDPHYSFAVMMVDIDRFQLINDSLGHVTGDAILREIAVRLTKCLRNKDEGNCDITHDATEGDRCSVNVAESVARLVGDEFSILLDDIHTPYEAVRMALRVLDALSAPLSLPSTEISLSGRVGMTVFRPGYRTAEKMLGDADAALHRAKSSPHLKYSVFDPSMHEAAVTRLHLESDLHNAIDRKELSLAYQPLICLRTRRVVGFEALLRWRRGGTLVSPADFIPLAEETGTIVPIGHWVLHEACRQLAKWRSSYSMLAECTVSVNISRRQVAEPNLLDDLKEALRASGLSASALKLEITESAIMTDKASSQQVLRRIRDHGIRLSMDDFGTGYSSLACLHEFPLDELKIDRGFLHHLAGQVESSAVLNAIVNLAHHLSMKVVAEGLETADQVVLLQTLDCDIGQGYHFAKPLWPEQVEAWIESTLNDYSKCA